MSGFQQYGQQGQQQQGGADYSKPYGGAKPVFNEFLVPVGLFCHLYHDKPQPETDDRTKQPKVDRDGCPLAFYKVTLAWPKAFMESALMPMRELAGKTVGEAWGPNAINDRWLNLQPFFRDGDNPEHNTKAKEYLFGRVYLNFKQKAEPIMINGQFVGRYQPGPQIIGPNQEDIMGADIFPGCEGRVSGIMFGTHYLGKNYISVRLNNIQLFRQPTDQEKAVYVSKGLGMTGRPDARSQFDPLAGGQSPGGTGAQLGQQGFGTQQGGFGGAAQQSDPFAGFGGGAQTGGRRIV
jgi:hypothetical protein